MEALGRLTQVHNAQLNLLNLLQSSWHEKHTIVQTSATDDACRAGTHRMLSGLRNY